MQERSAGEAVGGGENTTVVGGCVGVQMHLQGGGRGARE